MKIKLIFFANIIIFFGISKLLTVKIVLENNNIAIIKRKK